MIECVGPFGLTDGGCTECAECDMDVYHPGPCDCGHLPAVSSTGNPTTEGKTDE